MTLASPVGTHPDSTRRALERVLREHAAGLAAALVRVTGDFAAAEDLVQDAVLAALQRWPTEGIPDRPDSWLVIVARNRGLDTLRRESNYRTKLAQLQWPVRSEPDDRLRLIFTCCHWLSSAASSSSGASISAAGTRPAL